MEPCIYAKGTALAILLILSVVSDMRTYKISNGIIALFSLSGFLFNFIERGAEGLVFSLTGWLAPVVLLFMLFRMRMLGAGDIKLFAAIGAIMGCEFAIKSVLYSFLLGGIMCMALLAVRRNARESLLRIALYIKSCLQTQTIQEYADFEDHTDKGRFHFSFAVAPAVIFQIAATYLSIRGG